MVTSTEVFTMRTDRPLWEKVYISPWGKAYINAGRIIGHLGCSAFAFYDAAKLQPGYDKHQYETAVRDLTVWAKREQGPYELHPTARKVLRIIIGPAPEEPEYRRWWELRLISVRQMKEHRQPVEWAEEPPVPLEPVPELPKQPEADKPKARKRAAKRK